MYQDKLGPTKSTLVYALFATVIAFVVNSRTVYAQGAKEETNRENLIAEYNDSAIKLLQKAED